MKSIFKTMQKKVYKFTADSNVLDGNNINAPRKKNVPKTKVCIFHTYHNLAFIYSMLQIATIV